MNIRQLDGLEVQQALYVWSQSFERGDLAMEDWKEWETRIPDGRTTYGIVEPTGLQAAFLLIDESIHLGADTLLPMSAVCGVGVLPASRGKGYASAGVRYLFERMREGGLPITFLEPFSWDFYGRLGYAWTAPTNRYIVPARLLKASPETDFVRAASAGDRDAIVTCYTELARRYRGMVARRPQTWEWIFNASKKEHTYTYLYEREGRVEGYLTYHGGKREETGLDEFVTLTPRARQGLLGLLRRHEMQIDKFRWNAPPDDALWSALTHGDVSTKLTTRHMARIVDVPAALEAFRPPEGISGSLSIAVNDESAPWNHRTWRLETADGSISAAATSDAPGVSLDIQALTQAYLGTPTVQQLRLAGRLQVHDEKEFTLLETLLAGPPAWCCDGF